MERSTFIIVTGTLCPSESLAVTLNTVQELPTLPDGALRLLLPPHPHAPRLCRPRERAGKLV